MDRIEAGMAVFGVSGRRVGVVGEVADGCFEIRRERDDGGIICVTGDALFTVEARQGVTLVCEKAEVERYRCAEHTAG